MSAPAVDEGAVTHGRTQAPAGGASAGSGEDAPFADLVAHLRRRSGASAAECWAMIEEVRAYFSETAGTFVRRRHGELRREGRSNAQIFPVVAAELARRCVTPPVYTERQLRRIVYG